MLYCTKCAASNTATAHFYSRCGTPIHRPTLPEAQTRTQPFPSIENDELTVLLERASPLPLQSPSITNATALPSAKAPQFENLGQEVQHYRQKFSIQSKEKEKNNPNPRPTSFRCLSSIRRASPRSVKTGYMNEERSWLESGQGSDLFLVPTLLPPHGPSRISG